jgi:hypothetical protein
MGQDVNSRFWWEYTLESDNLADEKGIKGEC